MEERTKGPCQPARKTLSIATCNLLHRQVLPAMHYDHAWSRLYPLPVLSRRNRRSDRSRVRVDRRQENENAFRHFRVARHLSGSAHLWCRHYRCARVSTRGAAFHLNTKPRTRSKRVPNAIHTQSNESGKFHPRFKQAAHAISISCWAVTSMAVKVESTSDILTFGLLAVSASRG